MARKQGVPVLKTGSGWGRKVVGFALLAAAVVFVVSAPLEAAGHVRHVVDSLTAFFSSL